MVGRYPLARFHPFWDGMELTGPLAMVVLAMSTMMMMRRKMKMKMTMMTMVVRTNVLAIGRRS